MAVSCTLHAVPYASGIRNTSGSTWEFVLNTPADNVTIMRNGGNALNLGALSAGRHTFSMSGFSTFDIAVSRDAPEQWTRISDSANLFTSFEQPVGLAVNTNPNSPFFGTIYVNNARTSPTRDTPPAPDPPRPAREMGAGIYAMTADMIGVDLGSNFAVVTDPQDTTQAKAPGWTPNTGNLSPWRMTLDAGGNLVISDFGATTGGIKYATADLTTGGLVLAGEGNTPSSVQGEFGPIPLHSAITSKPYVTGTVGSDLTVWAMDVFMDPHLFEPAISGKSIWRWDVGSNTNHTINPALVVNTANIPQTTEASPRPNFQAPPAQSPPTNAHFEPQFNNWYLTQRGIASIDEGNSAGLTIVGANEADPHAPSLLWSSLQFSIDNNLDANSQLEGIQDVFRHAGSVAISPDGSKLFLHRSRNLFPTTQDHNPITGANSDLSGIILVIPLDANGIPNIVVQDGVMTNVDSITVVGNNRFHTNHEIAFDAAGNLYITHSDSELLDVYSPGGNTLATTSWNGSQFAFSIQSVTGIPGDHNGDGIVDARDYVVWAKNPGAFGGAGGYNDWRANFGVGTGSGSALGAAAVPEPATMGLVALGLLALLGVGRRR